MKEKQSTQIQAMKFVINTLALKDGKKSQLYKIVGFVNECRLALHEELRETALYWRPFSGLLERDQPTKDKRSTEKSRNCVFSVKCDF